MEREFVGPGIAARATRKGLASLYRLALAGEIRHRMNQSGHVEFCAADLGKLRPERRGGTGRAPRRAG